MLTLRAMRGADADFVSGLSTRAFSEFSRSAERSTLWMAEHYTTLVAERSRERVGFAVVRLEPPGLAELLAIAVVERERGRGVGRALLEAAESKARAQRSPGLLLHTADANLAALELFLKNGYVIRRRLPRYYVGVFSACEMVKAF